MEPHELTPEFAESVPLSFNPFERDKAVREVLSAHEDSYSVVLVGNEITAGIEPGHKIYDYHLVKVHPVIPLLGRRTLKKVAAKLEDNRNKNIYR